MPLESRCWFSVRHCPWNVTGLIYSDYSYIMHFFKLRYIIHIFCCYKLQMIKCITYKIQSWMSFYKLVHMCSHHLAQDLENFFCRRKCVVLLPFQPNSFSPQGKYLSELCKPSVVFPCSWTLCTQNYIIFFSFMLYLFYYLVLSNIPLCDYIGHFLIYSFFSFFWLS